MIRIMIALTALGLALTGMSQKTVMNDRSPEGKWILKYLQMEGQLQNVAAKAYQIEFSNDGQMSTKICNNIGGKFTITGNSISFGPVRSTKMMCPDMNYESAFNKAIMEADTIEYKGSEMILKKGKEIVMTLYMPVN
jgi:heat shock protein HslJ